MNLVTGAMGSLLPKLAELLKEEYKLKKSIKEGVESLEKEMRSLHAALLKVAEVPRDQLDEQVRLWAGEVRELSFYIEDVIDKFLVRVDGGSDPAMNSSTLNRLTKKMAGLFNKGKARHEIIDAIKDINKQVQEVANRRVRYTVDNIATRPISNPAALAPIDPRLRALYREVTELVGIVGKTDQELMKLLSEGDNESRKKLKIVSVVGFGGLGKTTLVKTVYDKIKRDFDFRAFVPIGRHADAKKVLMDILLDLGMYESQFTLLDERQLINKLRDSLQNKRYLVVIDDIWDEKMWTIINLAFSSSNNFGSRVITTSRNFSVSKLCCSSTNDSVYQMKPLNDEDSKRLFYRRIFSQEGRCPHEFEAVSVDILKKCGGMPLAIITIASLLTSDGQVKHVDEWYVLLDSIGRGLKEDPSVEEMLRILSFSYYDLPSHLKTCLLYLSMFPEDHMISKDRLIWMWIAESFVQCGKTKTSLFEIGETYFSELVNRSLIQPANYTELGREVQACQVHDMVLDLICSLSSEENFVTISNGTGDGMCSQINIRRLSLQNARKEKHQTVSLESGGMLLVRSIVTFKPAIGLMPSFASFLVLRVLDLAGCFLVDHNLPNLRGLGSLLHLRYLGLARTGISKVTEELGKLQFLQVLDLSGNNEVELPSAVNKLRRLMCLLIDKRHKRLPDGLGNLTSVEVLTSICCDSVSIVEELGNMERLRKLVIEFDNLDLEMEEAFVELLGKLSNIQSVEIFVAGYYYCDNRIGLLGECWVPPQSLQEFIAIVNMQFSTMPTWIRRDPSRLSQLCKLEIRIAEFRQEDLEVLGRLPALQSLALYTFQMGWQLLVGADGFRCLTYFKFSHGQTVFQPGAMPKAENVDLGINLLDVINEEGAFEGLACFDPCIPNLSSLRDVTITLFSSGVTARKARQVEAALRSALRAHPNRLTFRISFNPRIGRAKDPRDDDVYPFRKNDDVDNTDE